MCGINGIVALDAKAKLEPAGAFRSKLKKMNDLIFHRGPDSEGLYLKDAVGFGFRRLSIIDLSSSANQPMFSNDGELVLVFNGEIYNYIEIKKELIRKGYQFKTDSDTEVIINSYLEYGEKCVEKFNGMWALAIYDFRKNILFCSRDRLGVKPFYYCIRDGLFYFSSELKALHGVLNLNNANLDKVYEFLAYGYRIYDGKTFFEDCSELLPGSNLIIQNNELKIKNYWVLREGLYNHCQKSSYQEEYFKLFESAVMLRFRSDVPVALLLSGGLDSSSIAKVTDNLIESGRMEQNNVHAFIASFPNYVHDETHIARELVKTCKHIQLHEMEIDSKNVVDDIESTVYGFDHPVHSFNVVVHNNIMKACQARGIKVVLNGQGSDEAFAGYDRYISGVHLLDQLLSRKGNFFSEFSHLHHENKWSKIYLTTQMVKSVLNPALTAFLRAKFQEKSIFCLEREFIKKGYPHFKPGYQFSLKGNNFNNYLLTAIRQQGLGQILHYEDISSMQQSIEIRSPFLDYRMMEFAFSIPNHLKFRKGVTKAIIRETIGEKLPDSITKNRDKIGFNTPFENYLTNDIHFKAFVKDLLNSESFQTKKVWKPEKLQHVFNNIEKYPNFPYWRILNFELWSKAYGISNV